MERRHAGRKEKQKGRNAQMLYQLYSIIILSFKKSFHIVLRNIFQVSDHLILEET